MRSAIRFLIAGSLFAVLVSAQNSNNSFTSRWWAKYQRLAQTGTTAMSPGSTTNIPLVASNVDASNECGSQSETFITLNTRNPQFLAGGSNEILRNPMRGYSSGDGGNSWTGVDLPLPPPIGANGSNFGSDPSLAFDTSGNLFYS